MGQPLPLPEKIPRPNPTQVMEMRNLGIRMNPHEVGQYVSYTLPPGWSMVNDSRREDLPDWSMVDSRNMVRVSILGAWRGSHDDELSLYVVRQPYLFQRRNQPSIPNETDGYLIGRVAELFDSSRKDFVEGNTTSKEGDA